MNDKSIAKKKVLSNRVTVQAIYDRSLIFNRKKGKIFCDGIDVFYSNVATTLTLYNTITLYNVVTQSLVCISYFVIDCARSLWVCKVVQHPL